MFGVSRLRGTARAWRPALITLLFFSVAGCAALPAAAPTPIELTANANNSDGFDYSLVKLNARVIAILSHFRTGFAAAFHTSGHYKVTNAIARGDVIAITVYETGGPSLFPPPAVVPGAAAKGDTGAVSTGASNIPPQVVEADGTIYVPFVGRMKVTGLTPGEAGEQIAAALQGKAVSPQVLVSVSNNIGTAATVNGEVNSPRPVPITARGERLLDVIAAAGGPKFPAYETYVQVMRNGKVGDVLLQTIINNPSENIMVRPKDQIYVSRNPRTFAVLGATSKVNVYPFRAEKVTLAEAVAQAGGPQDRIGNPSGIYLFRFEPWSTAVEILDPAKIQSYQPNPPASVPVLYQVDMRDAEGFFLTQAMQMRDKDIVLVTNAEVTQLQKMVLLANQMTALVFNITRIDTQLNK